MAGLEYNHAKVKWFECSGGVGCDEDTINLESFLRHGETDIFNGNLCSESCCVQEDVVLFDRVFDRGYAFEHTKFLFKMARKEAKILEHSVPSHIDEMPSSHEITVEECKTSRKRVCELLHYIRLSLLSLPLGMKPLMDRFKNDLLSSLSSFFSCLPLLSTLPSIYHLNFSKKSSCSLYHMFHLNLDVHWYYISILLTIKKYADANNDSHELGMGFIIESRRFKEAEQLEKQIQSLLTELTSVALARFEKVHSSDLYNETPFTCGCVKELWLLLQFVCDSLSDSSTGKSFWVQVNSLLDRVKTRSQSSGSEKVVQNPADGSESRPFFCSDSTSFSLWMLLHLSHLYGYDNQGHFVGKKSIRVKSNFSQLEKILSSGINLNLEVGNEPQMEYRMRQYISMTSELCLERWWEPMRGEPVMIFWEYFHRRLSSSLIIPGQSIASLPMLSKSATGILEKVKKSLSGEERHGFDADSFCIFMKFLGTHLVCCREEESSLEENESGVFRQWQQMRGRIYSKLGPTKVKCLSQIGLHRFISLFLMLCITADVKEVGKKMLDMLALLRPWDPVGREFQKRELVWQAYMCLICLRVENGIDISQAATPLLDEVQEACNDLSKLSKSNSNTMFSDSWHIDTNNSDGLNRLLLLFTEGLNEIMDLSPKMSLSEYILIGPWLPQWLKLCSPSAARKLMDMLLTVVDKLRKLKEGLSKAKDHLSDLWGDSEGSEVIGDDGEASLLKEQWSRMEAALVEHVLPSIRNHCVGANPPFQAADLAVSFTLSAFHDKGENFIHLFTFFAASDTVNYRITRRYLCHILSNQKFMGSLSKQLSDYQDIIIQAWIRCSLLSVDESSMSEMEELTNHVARLKIVSQIFSSQVSSSSSVLIRFSSLEQFLRALGDKYDTLQTLMERSSLRERCSIFFNKVDKIIASPIRALSSEETIKSIYHCCGLMVLHCGNIIYVKGKPNALLPSIFSLLILPMNIYNPDTSLHKYILTAIRRSIDMYVRGLARLSPASDPYIKRCLRDTVNQYIPRLCEKNQGSAVFSNASSAHPLLSCFEISGNQNKILQDIVLETLVSILQSSRGKQVHIHAAKAVGLIHQISEIIRRKAKASDQGKELVGVVASQTLPGLFDFLLNVNEECQEWKMALSCINSIVLNLKEIGRINGFNHSRQDHSITYIEDCEENTAQRHSVNSFDTDSCGEVWTQVLSSVTQQFCQRNMAFSTSALFRVMHHFIRTNLDVVVIAYNHLKAEAKNVELRRGVGYDPLLRSCLQKLHVSLEEAKTQSKGR